MLLAWFTFRNLKTEINSVRHQDAQQRIHIANLNKELARYIV